MMYFSHFSMVSRVLVLMTGCSSVGVFGLRAGSDPAPVVETQQDTRPVHVRIEDYLRGQKLEYAIEPAAASNGQTTTFKIHGVVSPQQQESVCAGMATAGGRDRVQGVSAQFLVLEPRSEGSAQSFQPSSLPSGNGSVTTVQRDGGGKPEYRVLRTVKLGELAGK